MQRKARKPIWLFDCELAFWAQADEVGEHHIWRGPVDKAGRPVSLTIGGAKRRAPFSAALEAWWRIQRPPPAGELEPSCGEKLCIRPSHQAVRGAP